MADEYEGFGPSYKQGNFATRDLSPNPAYVERRDAIRARLALQRNRCASCAKMISMAYETKTKTKAAYHLPELGADYSQPLLCVKCWEKSQESERT